jgi:homocysteine S-methyltransferase
MNDFEKAVREGVSMLTDGGIETRVMFETDVELPEHVQVAALVDDPVGGPVLREIYGSYIDAARPCGLPVVIGTPTFRASLNFVRRAGLGGEEAVRRLNREAAMMLREIRAGSNYRPVPIAGVIGPSGDTYRPEESPSMGQAASTTGSRPKRSPARAWTSCTRRPSPRSRRPSARAWRWARPACLTWSASCSGGTGGCSTARRSTRPSSA